jgi:hypothetical protein
MDRDRMWGQVINVPTAEPIVPLIIEKRHIETLGKYIQGAEYAFEGQRLPNFGL